jgi:hypothetical protein
MTVVSAAILTILDLVVGPEAGRLNRNTSNAGGAEALVGALQRDHDGSILKNLPRALTAPETMDDGTAILGHVLGDRRSNVMNSVSRATKIDTDGDVSEEIVTLGSSLLGGLFGGK